MNCTTVGIAQAVIMVMCFYRMKTFGEHAQVPRTNGLNDGTMQDALEKAQEHVWHSKTRFMDLHALKKC